MVLQSCQGFRDGRMKVVASVFLLSAVVAEALRRSEAVAAVRWSLHMSSPENDLTTSKY